MFPNKWKLVLALLVIVSVSYQVLETLTQTDGKTKRQLSHYPDYTLENFTTLTMDQNGHPKNRLNAAFMAYYPDNNTSELDAPEFEIFRKESPSIMVTADKGWVTSDNQVVLLKDNVYLSQTDQAGELRLELIAQDARLLIDKQYAETDNATTLITKRMITNAIGMRAYLDEQRMEFLNNVHTIIEPNNAL